MQNIEAVQFEALFDRRLQMYDVDQEMVKEEGREQQDAIQRLQTANAAFVNARRGDQSTKQREQALQSLENAYYKYKEIIANLDTGRKFYNDLSKIVSRFRDDCRSFVYQRKQEASQVEGYVLGPHHVNDVLMMASDIANSMSALSLQQANSSSLQQQRQEDAQNPQYGAAAHADAPLAAPTPTRASVGPGMWTPEMPIRFAAVPTASGGARPANGPAQDGRWDPTKGLKFG
jgi:programmed cell death 6-interacting protein